MQVVHICNLPIPPDHPDYGRIICHPGRWVLNLALAQKRHTEIQPQLVIQIPGSGRNHQTEIEGIPCHFLAAPDKFRSATLFRFDASRIGRCVLGLNPDLVHVHGTEDAHLLAAQWTRLPYVVTAQGLYSQINHIMPPRPFSRARVVEWIERRSLARTRHIIAKSGYVADWIHNQYPHLHIHRIPNTFDPRLLEIEIPEKEPGSLAFVGTITPRKGLHLLVEALLQSEESGKIRFRSLNLPPFSLHLIGNVGDGVNVYDKEAIQGLRDALGVRLHLHGILDPVQTAKIIARCQFLVAPSLEEMFGNQVIEAFLMNTHPIVSSGTAMEENVRHIGFGTVFQNGDPDSLTETLRSRLSTFSLSQTARQRVIDWLGPETIARQHLKLYEEVV